MIMLRSLAITYGIAFAVIGMLGFLPAVTPSGLLFGVFAVDVLHNLIHLITGGVAVGMAVSGERTARLYFRVFGVIYLVVAAFGLYYGDNALLGAIAHNWADVALHLAAALIALYLGFFYRRRTPAV